MLGWRRRPAADQRPSPSGAAPSGGLLAGGLLAGGPPTAAQEVAALRTSLRATVQRVNRAADRLPEGVVPQVRAIEDALRELLDHVEATAGSATSAQERYTLAATVDDYLPTSIDAFLALPASFAETHRTPAGRSPGEELLEQLVVLASAVTDLAQAVYSGDAERLSTQGRFLASRFATSALDLG